MKTARHVVLLLGQLLMFCLPAAGVRAAGAADLAEIPPPTPPFVAPLPEMGDWTITVTPQKKEESGGEKQSEQKVVANSSGANGVSVIHSTRTGRVKRDEIAYKNGRSQTYWFAGDAIISLRANKKDYAVSNASIMAPGNNIKGIYREIGNRVISPGFPGFDWLKLKYYAGVELFEKSTPSYHFVLKGLAPETGETIIAAEAWVDVATKMPLRYRSEGADFTYHFAKAPEEKLQLPVALPGFN